MSPREFKTLVDSGSCTVIDTRSVSGGGGKRREGEGRGGEREEEGKKEGKKEGGGK